MGRFNFPLMFEDSVLQNQFLHIYHLMGYLESGEIKEVKKNHNTTKKIFWSHCPAIGLIEHNYVVVPDSMWSTVPSKKNLLAAVNKR